MRELDVLRTQLAEFFCEDAGSFKIEECFKVFYNFCEKFKQAVKENEKRRLQEEQAMVRRKQREEQLANKKRQCKSYFAKYRENDPRNISFCSWTSWNSSI